MLFRNPRTNGMNLIRGYFSQKSKRFIDLFENKMEIDQIILHVSSFLFNQICDSQYTVSMRNMPCILMNLNKSHCGNIQPQFFWIIKEL